MGVVAVKKNIGGCMAVKGGEEEHNGHKEWDMIEGHNGSKSAGNTKKGGLMVK